MLRFALLMVALLVYFQPPTTPPRHDKYKDDPVAYCWNPASSGTQVKHREADVHAHKCSCRLMCQLDEDGEVVGDQEDGTCQLYCTRTHCTCHVEEPCEMKEETK
jgi:hypothetical protein